MAREFVAAPNSPQTNHLRQRFGARPELLNKALGARSCCVDGDRAAGSPQQRISLANSGYLPWLCCQAPAMFLFSSMAIFVLLALLHPAASMLMLSGLTLQVYCWIAGLAVFGAIGVCHMRRALAVDWNARWRKLVEEQPEDAAACAHIVILPNYREDEHMLSQTLDNLARSEMARERMYIVLAMEAREGLEGEQKAASLINRNQSRFADIIATFHPENLPGETAGKSANCQWAFRKVQHLYGPSLGANQTCVFVTVGDADTLWHPQYFTALAVQGLALPEEKRQWAMWQPPVLLIRNYLSVPGPIRVSGYAAFMFELSGLTGQWLLGTHFCYSAYSLTLALANHPSIDGWDTDVIAEDHHMFCKCYFASIRNSLSAVDAGDAAVLSPQVELHPVFLPAVSYMVESSAGWVESCKARFQQARRHAQGIAELAYTLLQYVQLLRVVGFGGLSCKAHMGVFSIISKMTTVHLTNTFHAFAVMVTSHCMVSQAMSMLYRGELWAWLVNEIPALLSANPLESLQSFAYLNAALILGTFAPLSLMMAYTSYQVLHDSLEGRLFPPLVDSGREEQVQGAACTQTPTPLGKLRSFGLAMLIWLDYTVLGETTILLYGLIPETLACWSLSRRGNNFEYIVAAKPN